MPKAHDLAQELGQKLGAGQVLLRPLPGACQVKGANGLRAHPPFSVAPCRHLILVLGDQLWLQNPALEGINAAQDRVLMIEAASEAQEVWSHKARIALFLAAMRQFCNALHRAGVPYAYRALAADASEPEQMLSFSQLLSQYLRQFSPKKLIVCEPGEWRMQLLIEGVCTELGVPLEWRMDTHFMCSKQEFAAWAGTSKSGAARKELRMEFFYREMRRKHGVLMQEADATQPEGGQWNFDADNRAAFPKTGPGQIEPPTFFTPDRSTQEVLDLVATRFAEHPGSLEHFVWPVTREQALEALARFIEARLPRFGAFQDAMWTQTPFGWHALLSTSLNLHLLDPREVIAAAQNAWAARGLELAGVEGFIRQILGWREFIRGVYWLDMPHLKTANFYGHTRPLPKWYWTGETHMACMRETIGQTLKYGYAHHIQRLMVTGQFALLAGLSPQAVCDWYLAVYVDAVEWVELPNVAGMALFANAMPNGNGRFTSKPYIASGQYIKRQSNYCADCRYKPEQRTGAAACPVTTLFWAFLDTHEAALAANPRTAMMARNITRLSPPERELIRTQAQALLEGLDAA